MARRDRHALDPCGERGDVDRSTRCGPHPGERHGLWRRVDPGPARLRRTGARLDLPRRTASYGRERAVPARDRRRHREHVDRRGLHGVPAADRRDAHRLRWSERLRRNRAAGAERSATARAASVVAGRGPRRHCAARLRADERRRRAPRYMIDGAPALDDAPEDPVSRVAANALAIAVQISSTCFAQGLAWRLDQLHDVPDCRMVFDTARNRVVAVSSTADQGGTLFAEWDGAHWRKGATAAGPSARIDFGLAYDVHRSRVVLLGGQRTVPTEVLDDLWEYDGVDWVQIATAIRPPARYRPTMAYDRARARTVVAGGKYRPNGNVAPRSDTWAWDGSAWVDLGAAAPALDTAEMAWHPSTGTCVMFGLQPIVAALLTWTFDGTTWTQRAPNNSPPLALDYRMATDVAADRVLLLASGSQAVWEWNGTDWAQRPVPFDARVRFGFAADDAGTGLVHGGQVSSGSSNPRFTDTLRIDAAGITTLSQGGPDGTNGLLLAHDSLRNRTVGVVPFVGAAPTPATVWEWDGNAWTKPVAATPAGSLVASLCFDFFRGRTVRFGGWRLIGNVLTPVADVDEWDGTQWQTRATVGPPARFGHAMAFDFARGVALLFGGSVNATTVLGDTWQWNGSIWTQLAQSGPLSRAGHAMAADPVRARVVLFGGWHQLNVPLSDTWEWTGAAWTQRAPAHSPPGRRGHRLDYDFAGQRVVLAGGDITAPPTRTDVWEWDGTDWTLQPNALPVVGTEAAGAAIGAPRWMSVTRNTTWIGAPRAATVSVAGTACGTTTIPALRAFGDPVAGSHSFAVELHRAGANAPFLLAIGAGTASTPIGAGCTLYLPQVDDARVGAAGPSGYAGIALPAPNAPQLLGLVVTLQAGALDASAPLGFALSNALVARIGQ